MITQVFRSVADPGPASVAPALQVAYELHAPAATRAPEPATGRTPVRRTARRRTTARAQPTVRG
ncbi:hypothetical protein [Streptomyces sp. NPDC003635]